MSNNHDIIRHCDEYQCSKCCKSWDIKDDDPPPCTPVARVTNNTKHIDKLREILKNDT